MDIQRYLYRVQYELHGLDIFKNTPSQRMKNLDYELVLC